MNEAKKIEIEIPNDFDSKSAQDCFNFGLRALTSIYCGNVLLAYTTEETKEQGITNVLFKNEPAAAMIKMSKILLDIENSTNENKIESINNAGNELLKDFFGKK